MKIVYLIAGTYRAAGMERVLAMKANALAGAGHDILIVTTEQKGRKPAFPLHEGIRCKDLGIGYEDNNGKGFLDKAMHYPSKICRHRKLLKALLQEEMADIVVSMFCNDASFVPGIKDGSKKVLEAHFSRFKRIQYGNKGLMHLSDIIRNRIDGRTASRYDRFVVLTQEDSSYWGPLPNLHVIPNAISHVEREPVPQTGKRVIAVGRLDRQKGFDLLLEAWKKVPPCGWTLHIYGDGELRDSLLRKIADLSLQDRAFLEGRATDMRGVYLGAGIVALSSRYEGLPMVLLEAQGMGLPCVAFRCKCGPADILEDGVNGLLVDEGDTEGFAKALSCLMSDRDRRIAMGQAALSNAARYSEDTVMKMWNELFREVTDE